MSTQLDIRKETTQDRILLIFQGFPGKALMGETVVIEFEERFGRNGTSDTVRTGISALTRKGYLLEAGEVTSPTTKEPVKTWVLNQGPITPLPEVTNTPRQQAKQALTQVPAVKTLLTKLDIYFGNLPDELKQEVLHYEVNQLLEKL